MQADTILPADQFDPIARSFSVGRLQPGDEQGEEELDCALKTLTGLMRERLGEKKDGTISHLRSEHQGEAHLIALLETIASQIGGDFTMFADRIDQNILVESKDQVRADFRIIPGLEREGPFRALETILRADKYKAALRDEGSRVGRTLQSLEQELATIVKNLDDLEWMEMGVATGSDFENWRPSKKARFESLRGSGPNMEARHMRLLQEMEAAAALQKDLKELSFEEHCSAEGSALIESLRQYCDKAKLLLGKHARSDKAQAIEMANVLGELLELSVVLRRAHETRRKVSSIAPHAVRSRRGHMKRWATRLGALGLLGAAALYFWPEGKESSVSQPAARASGVDASVKDGGVSH